jgi:3-hydroxyisobutyrate dehydrogenase
VGAEQASLQIMVGCDADLFPRLEPPLRAIGDKITYIGEVGAGEVAKLVHNQIALVVQQVVAEALTLGVKAGIAPEKLLEAIRGGAYGRSEGDVGQDLEKSTLRGNWENPRFALALARKDLGLASDLAGEYGVPMPLAAAAEQALIECVTRGWGGKDMTAIFALQEEREYGPGPHYRRVDRNSTSAAVSCGLSVVPYAGMLCPPFRIRHVRASVVSRPPTCVRSGPR